MTHIPLTRRDALIAGADFLPTLGSYAQRRNHVEPLHRNVSRLSAALRYRLLLEDEVVHDTLRTHEFRAVEKWLQEVCWRRYWKGWLEMRPDVWTSWRRRVRELTETLPEAVMQRAREVEAGGSGVACMDAIARELIATGYLHNHARMWWASYWIHVERLPWELGADVFFCHLLDADPASNTLSWRWVAGLQTPRKTYLVRLSNIEKYAPEILLHNPAGSERIADGTVSPTVATDFADTVRRALPDYPAEVPRGDRRVGLWLHSDDLLSEAGPLANLTPVTVAAFSSEHNYRHDYALSERHLAALDDVLTDGLARAAAHFKCPTVLSKDADPAASLCTWAAAHALDEVVAFAPMIGPVADLVPRLRQLLTSAGITLTLLRRASDADVFMLAGAGFFPFWEKMSRHLREQSSPAAAR
ncbi:MAG: FAD-binding domain-containing protein [Chthoniobacteraceae bacterium]